MVAHPLRPKGVNLGCWLLMEGYILGGRNIPEHAFKAAFADSNGPRALRDFERAFRATFITENDFANIAAMGATAIRLPFNARLVEPRPHVFADDGLRWLLTTLDAAHRHGLKVILDLHAAPGAQNHDWHSDSAGTALLWEDERCRERTVALWEYIADAVKAHPALHGYDVLNEPVVGRPRLPRLRSFYRTLVRRIKQIDPIHTIYLEGNIWSQQIDFLADLLDDGVAVSVHAYQPLSYTFNLTPRQRYPGSVDNEHWRRSKISAWLKPYADFSRKHTVEIYVGEFGINWRGGLYGEMQWLDDIMSEFDSHGFGYAYWTYKAVANSVFPDGIYQLVPNNPYVRREGPVYGWETYAAGWKKDRRAIIDTWKTERYTPLQDVITVLRKHFQA